MREWILQNTEVTATEYDSLINPITTIIEGKNETMVEEYTKRKLFEHPLIPISRFTKNRPTIKTKIKYRIRHKKGCYIHKKVKFYILADLLKSMQEQLYSTERIGNCIELSCNICTTYNNTRIVAAMCIEPFFKEPYPFIHIFIIHKDKNNQEFALDGTLNIATDKETYLKLLEAKIINDIPREIYSQDLNLLKTTGIGEFVDILEYLCFRDKIMESVKKLTRKK